MHARRPVSSRALFTARRLGILPAALAFWVVPNSSEILDVEIRKDLDLPIAATALAVCLAAAFPGARYGALSTY